MERKQINTLFNLENSLTIGGGRTHYGAQQAFTAIYERYAMPGVQALAKMGCSTPEQVWDFFHNACGESLTRVAEELGLNKSQIETDQPAETE